MDKLNKLFTQLSQGGPVSFFEVMAAINEISNLWPDTRPASQDLVGDEKADPTIANYPCQEPGEFCELC